MAWIVWSSSVSTKSIASLHSYARTPGARRRTMHGRTFCTWTHWTMMKAENVRASSSFSMEIRLHVNYFFCRSFRMPMLYVWLITLPTIWIKVETWEYKKAIVQEASWSSIKRMWVWGDIIERKTRLLNSHRPCKFEELPSIPAFLSKPHEPIRPRSVDDRQNDVDRIVSWIRKTNYSYCFSLQDTKFFN